ncbi:MAG TPA: mannosyltransferase [Bacteroidales bacterium]|nr:mannosyltransferase [Bacteroidales bacterium]
MPYPPDYGGIIDCYHRIRSLHNAGIKVHLHVYEYGRPRSKELETICEEITYYTRDTSIARHFSLLPYSVVSRKSDEMIENLAKDDFPVLFDGIQTTLNLDHPTLKNRKKAVRIHNIEPLYYRTLAKYEKNIIKKLYYSLEAARLRRYEKILSKPDYLLTVSIVDHDYYNRKFGNSVMIPSSHPYDHADISTGKGEYILYHGDLSVNENLAVSEYLITKVFSKVPYRCIISGKNPPAELAFKIAGYGNISLIPNPDNGKMDNLIRNAHINVLPTMASNGLKLKLLISLYCGRHCIVNSTTINGSGLYSLCHIADSPEKMIQKITNLMDQPFTEDMIEDRRKVLSRNHDNKTNAGKLIDLLFPAL